MRAHAIAQPNIALIKYWGKRDTARNHARYALDQDVG
jgi:mevalonate pyrophosphate decarboxylase